MSAAIRMPSEVEITRAECEASDREMAGWITGSPAHYREADRKRIWAALLRGWPPNWIANRWTPTRWHVEPAEVAP